MRFAQVLIFSCMFSGLSSRAYAASECTPSPLPSSLSPEVYAASPYKAGEHAKYKVYYAGVMVGYGDLNVLPATQLDGQWYQQITMNAATGDWYKYVFIGRNSAMAWSRTPM